MEVMLDRIKMNKDWSRRIMGITKRSSKERSDNHILKGKKSWIDSRSYHHKNVATEKGMNIPVIYRNMK